MTTTLNVQRALVARGFNLGPVDGLIGPATLAAINRLPISSEYNTASATAFRGRPG